MDAAGLRFRFGAAFVFFAGRGRGLRFAAFDLAAAALRRFNTTVTAVTMAGTAAAATAAVILPILLGSLRAIVGLSQIRRGATTL